MPRSEAENQRLRERQRANILDAAMGVFAHSGPSASMAEIAGKRRGSVRDWRIVTLPARRRSITR